MFLNLCNSRIVELPISRKCSRMEAQNFEFFSILLPKFPTLFFLWGASRGNVALVQGHRPHTVRDWVSRGVCCCETPAASEGGPPEGGAGKGTQKSKGPTS